MEPLWRNGTHIERLFSQRADVRCRCSSMPLQRVMTDFGADVAFGQVPDKLKEHYGITMSPSTIRRTTEHHAKEISEWESSKEIKMNDGPGGIFIGELDGSMAPVVQPSLDEKDKRKGKTLCWKEIKLNLVYRQGSTNPVFGGSFFESVDESGYQWWRSAVKSGFNLNSCMHAIGDGATWIKNQSKIQFGSQGHYLVDFFHVCEYLSDASKVCEPEDSKSWVDTQKDRLKNNDVKAVREALKPFIDNDCDDHPVTSCDRYLGNRLEDLDYKGAIEKGLPIGSGEIESAHRYVIQERIKLPGAWWSISNLKAMLALRLNRANQEWNDYWNKTKKGSDEICPPIVASL